MGIQAADAAVSIISGVLGCGIAAYLAKLVLERALEQLDTLRDKVTDISSALSAISVSLEHLSDRLEECDSLLKEHSSKLSHLESSINDASSRIQRYVQ